VATNCSS